MKFTRKQIVISVSILWLLVLVVLASVAFSRLSHLSVPIPDSLALATTLLPIVSGIILPAGYSLTRQQEQRKRLPRGETPRDNTPRPPYVIIANTIIFIYSTVVITLLGTHAAPPAGLDCRLRERWTTLFSHKNVDAIRTIQQAFNCCGLKNSRDMAWPFPDKTHDARSCETTFGRTNGCLGPWKGEEQRMAGRLMGIVGLVFIWQVVIIAIPTQRESWLYRILPGRLSRIIADEEHGNGRPRQAIDYLSDFNRYTDRVEEDASDGEAENRPRRAIEGDAQPATNASGGRADEEQQHPPVQNA